jgi:putative spermidine/putrescine transport system permease protein
MLGTSAWVRVPTIVVFIFLLAPLVIVVLSSFSASGYMTFPPSSLSLRWFEDFFNDPDWMSTLGVTVVLSTLAAFAGVALSFCTALFVVRKRTPLNGGVEFLILLPLVFPHAALAIAMWSIVLKLGLLGTFLGVMLAHAIITLPYAYRPIIASLRKLDLSAEEAAMSLGAAPLTVFRRVTLPLVRPGLITAFLFCFIISFDEATVTLFLVGPNFTTLPIKIFSAIQDNASPIVAAISTLLIVFTATVVIGLDRLVGLELFVDPERPT